MAATGLHDVGEEWAQKTLWRQDDISREGSLDVLLYDDSSDDLGDGDDVGDISTEPDSGDYERQPFNLDSSDVELSVEGGDVRATALVTFDVTDTDETIDAYAVVANFTSDVVEDESSANDHLVTSATVDERDLGQNDSVDVEVRLDLN